MPGLGNRSRAHLTVIGQQPGAPSRASKWDPSLCEAVIALAREGKFPEEWAAELGVSFRTFQTWTKRYPEFREAMEMARIHLEAHWSCFLRENLTNPRLRGTLLIKMMERRFPRTWGPNAVSAWEELGVADKDDQTPWADPDSPEARARRMSREELEREAAEIFRRWGILKEQGSG